MSGKSPEDILAEAQSWWTTSIIDIHPGKIAIRGYPIQSLIGAIGFAQMVWLMLRGELPSLAQARLLEAAMVASVDHGPQAPSIAIARMAASVGVDLNNAIASAVNVLGDVHGGAGQQCMEIYEAIADKNPDDASLPATADAALEAFCAQHGRIIPGFGHRFHPLDPRVAPLMAEIEQARAAGAVEGRYVRIGRAVEAAVARRTGKPLPMNIDGITAIVFCELGFAPPLGRGLFVLSRAVGILAHAWEETVRGGRMKGPMPKSISYQYDGPAPRELPE